MLGKKGFFFSFKKVVVSVIFNAIRCVYVFYGQERWPMVIYDREREEDDYIQLNSSLIWLFCLNDEDDEEIK